MDLSIHGSLSRELPKAEGVAFNTHRDSPCYRMASPYVGPAGFIYNTAVTLRPRATPSVSRLRRETARGRHGRREGAFCCTAGTVRHGKEICGRKIFPDYMDLLRTRLPREGAAERLRELPAALPGYFLLQETFLYAVPVGLAATQQLHCGRGQLPQSRACGARQHAADTAAAREPFVVPPGQCRLENNHSAGENVPTT